MGFPQLADIVAQDTDKELYIFRSFNTMSTRILLQLQSELASLEKEQQRLDEEATKIQYDRRLQMMLTSWRSLEDLDSEARSNSEVVQRVELASRIADKLERYCECLDVHHVLC